MDDDQPFGYVVVDPGSPAETTRPLLERLFVGRECAGVDDAHRILLGDDLAVSRNHLEIRVDPEQSPRRRGRHVEQWRPDQRHTNRARRGRPTQRRRSDPGRQHLLEFRATTVTTQRPESTVQRSTVSVATPMTMAMIVGDLINFSTVSEQADQQVLVRDVHHLYTKLRELLAEFRGTLVDYVGDAFFASWELEVDPAAAVNALRFALSSRKAGVRMHGGLRTPLRRRNSSKDGLGSNNGPGRYATHAWLRRHGVG